MIIYTGIDLSINCTGLASVKMVDKDKFELVELRHVKPKHQRDRFAKKLDNFEIFQWCATNLSAIRDSAFFVFENYSYGSPGHLADLGELTGLYKYHITKNMNKQFDIIAPTSVKKIITGRGQKISKEDVRAGLQKYLINFDSIEWSNYDESDAAAIAVAYGLSILENTKDESE